MSRRRRRRGTSRRRFLLYAGGTGTILLGAAAASNQTDAFSSIGADRISTASVASDDQGIVGIVEIADQGTVKKNDREPMIEITNNASEAVTYEVALDTCSDGTLYDNDGESGCSVTFDLMPGNSQFVDIEAAVTGTIGYSVTTSGGLSLETNRSIDAESGNEKGNVRIKAPVKDDNFHAYPAQGNEGDVFEIDKVDIEDDSDTEIGLAEIKYEIREGGSGGRLVAEKTVTPPDPSRYNPKPNPAETIKPNDGETIQDGALYALRVRAENNDGDFNSETVEDTTDEQESETVFEFVEIKKGDSQVVYFALDNVSGRDVTVTSFSIDATPLASDARVDNDDSAEVEIRRGTQDGEANRENGAYDADGRKYRLDTNATIDSGTNDAEVDIRLLVPKSKLKDFDLTNTGSQSAADVTVTLYFSSGTKQSFYFEDVS